MKIVYFLLVFAIATTTISCKKKENKNAENTTSEEVVTVEAEPEVKKLKVTLEPKSGSNARGTVIFNQNDGEVYMTALFEGLTEGSHAIHIHESSDCSAPDGTSTGGHWNPTRSQHGKWGDETGYHRGDIGNFTVDASGNGSISFKTDEWCIGCDDPTKNIIGKAIIVHEGVDDFTTQPTGDAGGRVSCGGIIE
ncbi:MAG TPA: superoxide dismutase family protein [Flavobacteriaceae bacterium]|nr:superoxide dismutase family protein [Flavobacteriaceae bacterium]